jgi:hypothetical protein
MEALSLQAAKFVAKLAKQLPTHRRVVLFNADPPMAVAIKLGLQAVTKITLRTALTRSKGRAVPRRPHRFYREAGRE